MGLPHALFTLGGLRGGGAVAAYMDGHHISHLLWRISIKDMSTLEHYLQGLAAARSLQSISEQSRLRIIARQAVFELSVLATVQRCTNHL